jgi:hypothetical protein
LPTFGAVLFLSIAACGGRLEGASADGSNLSPAEAEHRNEPVLPEDGEWGTWQLISVDGADGSRRYDPPFVELDLHSDGKAYLWRCAAASTGTGQRCPYFTRHGCLVGTISLSGTTWRVHFPSKDGSRTAGQADIVDEPSGDITVDGEGPIPSGGHYRRVGAASQDRCAP